MPVPAKGDTRDRIVDCDAHPYFRHPDELLDYLPDRWRTRSVRNLGRPGYRPPNAGRRLDSKPPDGSPSGSDPVTFERQLFGEAGVDYAILIDLLLGTLPDSEFDAALHAGVNAWMADTWLSKYNHHGRYRGSITLPMGDPQAAVREIEKWAGHPYFVQVRVPDSAGGPLYGHPEYHPVWAAASRHGLPVAIHVASGGARVPMFTPVGFLQYFLELHATAYPLAFAAQLTSLVCEGVFHKFEGLRFVFVEGGFSWLAPLLWHLDRNWSRLKAEVPDVRRRPSDYVRDHVRFTTQPMEEPDRQEDLVDLMSMIDAENMLMFATDYPHWDYDAPAVTLPSSLPPDVKRKIFSENAMAWYGLPQRPAENLSASERAAGG